LRKRKKKKIKKEETTADESVGENIVEKMEEDKNEEKVGDESVETMVPPPEVTTVPVVEEVKTDNPVIENIPPPSENNENIEIVKSVVDEPSVPEEKNEVEKQEELVIVVDSEKQTE